MGRKNILGYVCERCGHEWVKRQNSPGEPKVCPKCKSPYWDTPRKMKIKNPAGKRKK
jgi:predicted Zn-ribbon and HTH transcriptional regulator